MSLCNWFTFLLVERTRVPVCVYSAFPPGPFPSSDMREWFDEGYFTLDLMVRRACDEIMLPLGELGHGVVCVCVCVCVCVYICYNHTC